MRGLGSILTWGNILTLDFISHSKASDANIGIIANFVWFVKNPTVSQIVAVLVNREISDWSVYWP